MCRVRKLLDGNFYINITSLSQIYCATNYAETSVTLKAISYVVDNGETYVQSNRFEIQRDSRGRFGTDVPAVETIYHTLVFGATMQSSQDELKQRMGRIGRVRKGVYCATADTQDRWCSVR